MRITFESVYLTTLFLAVVMITHKLYVLIFLQCEASFQWWLIVSFAIWPFIISAVVLFYAICVELIKRIVEVIIGIVKANN